MQPSLRLGDIVARLGGELIGDAAMPITRVATLKSAGPDHIAFFSQTKYRDELKNTRAGAVIVANAERNATDRARIVCGDPYLYFAQVSLLLNPPAPVVPGVHHTAVVAVDADVADSVSIAAGCVIEKGARIEANVVVGAGSVVGAQCVLGEGTHLHARVTLYPGCVIGKRAIVHSGVVIGADGFGFAPTQGRWQKIPQIGRVLIGDDVEIGANTTIDRGALDDTVIEDGVKLDNQIQIGHNVRIGAHTAVAGCTGIAGSTTIGKHCMIGGASMIGGHLNIVDGVILSGSSIVTRSIDTPGMYSNVLPATPVREWRRTVAQLRRLDRKNQTPRQSGRDGMEQEDE